MAERAAEKCNETKKSLLQGLKPVESTPRTSALKQRPPEAFALPRRLSMLHLRHLSHTSLVRIADDVGALWCRGLRASLDAFHRAFGIQFVAQPVKEHIDQESTAKQSKRR
jgi:hypothetical protein